MPSWGIPDHRRSVSPRGATVLTPAAALAVSTAEAVCEAADGMTDNTAIVRGHNARLRDFLARYPKVQRRVGECARLGFKNVLLPRSCMRGLKLPEGVRAWGVETIGEALRTALVMPASNADKPTHNAAE